jgi:hypothetical protein
VPTAQKIARPAAAPTQPVAKPRRGAPPKPQRSVHGLFARGALPLMVLLVAALTILPTTIVVAVGLVPSLVALVVDDSRKRYLFRSVLGMNLAALWPFLERLWVHGNDVRMAMVIVSDVYTWAAIYGAAGLGWMMFLGLPTVMESYKKFAADRRIRKLTQAQEKLREEWGSVLPQADDGEQTSENRAEPSG